MKRIPIFRNVIATLPSIPKFPKFYSRKLLLHLIPQREFPKFLVEWNVPQVNVKSA